MKRNAQVQKALDALDELLQGNIPGLNEGMKYDLNNARRTLCHEAFVIKEEEKKPVPPEPQETPEPVSTASPSTAKESPKEADKPSSAEQRLKSGGKK